NLKNVSLSLFLDGVKISERFGELLLTHFGISGPIAMDMSREIDDACSEGSSELYLDLKPALTLEVLAARIGRDFEKYAGGIFRDSLKDLLPRGIIPSVLEKSAIPPEKRVSDISSEERNGLAHLLKAMPLAPSGLLGFDWSIVTSGGVSLKEIEPATMKSKLAENLFFAGEILDIDGPTGGFNLQMCWSTGYIAGESAAEMYALPENGRRCNDDLQAKKPM
ncbi:MAG: aminoacetone oxidase family FAD-binding enzyme, partial [Synergistaceae bacterium]|nr:aminoacetone oxidase family FAD-binding enzyme [Synergistaceae bacterium]